MPRCATTFYRVAPVGVALRASVLYPTFMSAFICNDERQFVPASGQSWTTLEGLRNSNTNKFRRLAAGLTTIETTPTFGIGQRAILARTQAGNVLWDCIALIDEATIDLLNGLGGVAAIAISH